MTPSSILRRVREKIGEQRHWSQRAGARSAAGREVEVDDPVATAWCVYGAVRTFVPSSSREMRQVDFFLSRAASEMFGCASPSVINDNRLEPILTMRRDVHARVLAMIDRAIILAVENRE